ncbi:hypothetical protein PIROE2DRAFT_8214, partial [Piromyces sp. E2]
MNNKISLIYCLLLLLVNHIHGTVMNKNDILKLEAIDSMGNKNCPEYSHFDSYRDWCSFKFYCKDEICASDVNGIIELPTEGNNTKTYIVDICQPDNTPCHTKNACFLDNDCLSNKCFNNTCMANEKSPVIMCTDNYSYSLFSGSSSTTVCGLSNGEKCSGDSDCAGGK